jgi:hypothetical protein
MPASAFAGIGAVPGLQLGQAERVAREACSSASARPRRRGRARRARSRRKASTCRRLGHLGHQRQVGVAGDGRAARPLRWRSASSSRISAPLSSAAGPNSLARVTWRGVERLAQRPVLGVLHHRHVGGGVQGQPAGARRGPRPAASRAACTHVVGHAVEFGDVDVERPAVGGVEHVFAERCDSSAARSWMAAKRSRAAPCSSAPPSTKSRRASATPCAARRQRARAGPAASALSWRTGARRRPGGCRSR